MTVMRARPGRRKALRIVGTIAALLGLTLTLTAQGGGGGKKTNAPPVAEVKIDEGDGKCTASDRSDAGSLKMKILISPGGTLDAPSLVIRYDDPTFDPKSAGKVSVPVTKGVLDFGPAKYQPTGKGWKDGVKTFTVTGNVAIVPLGSSAASWDKGESIRVRVAGASDKAGTDEPADCKATFKLGDWLTKKFDCLSNNLDLLYRLVVKMVKTADGWEYVIISAYDAKTNKAVRSLDLREIRTDRVKQPSGLSDTTKLVNTPRKIGGKAAPVPPQGSRLGVGRNKCRTDEKMLPPD